jgi:hypothetical protein
MPETRTPLGLSDNTPSHFLVGRCNFQGHLAIRASANSASGRPGIVVWGPRPAPPRTRGDSSGHGLQPMALPWCSGSRRWGSVLRRSDATPQGCFGTFHAPGSSVKQRGPGGVYTSHHTTPAPSWAPGPLRRERHGDLHSDPPIADAGARTARLITSWPFPEGPPAALGGCIGRGSVEGVSSKVRDLTGLG